MIGNQAKEIIHAAFVEEDIVHYYVRHGNGGVFHAPYSRPNGQLVDVQFKICEDTVFAKIPCLFKDVPKEKWPRVLHTLNVLNCEVPYAKFCLHPSGNISIIYDLPQWIDEACIGTVACGVYYEFVYVVSNVYDRIVESINGTPDNDSSLSEEEIVKELLDDDDSDWSKEDVSPSVNDIEAEELSERPYEKTDDRNGTYYNENESIDEKKGKGNADYYDTESDDGYGMLMNMMFETIAEMKSRGIFDDNKPEDGENGSKTSEQVDGSSDADV